MEEQVSAAGSISSSKTNLPSETAIDNGRISFSNSFCNSVPSSEKLLKNELKFEEQSQLAKLMGDQGEGWHVIPISAKQTIGSFNRDNVGQTDNQIISIQELNKIAKMLSESNEYIKAQQDISNTSLKTFYESEITAKASSIYSRVNEAIGRMENIYQTEVKNIRQASRQELDNAISTLRDEYIAYYENELRKRLKNNNNTSTDYAMAGAAAQSAELGEKLTILMQENEQLRQQLEFNSTPQVIEDTSAADAANAENKKLQGEMSGVIKKLEATQVDLTLARQEIDKLEKSKKQMEVSLRAEQEQNKKLQSQCRELEKKVQEQEKAHRAAISKLTTDYEAEKKGLIEGYEKRLQEQKNDYESQLQQAKENALATITALEIELTKSQKQAQSLNGKLGKLNKNLASIQSENAAANARAQQAERESAESRAAANAPAGNGENHSQRVRELEIELDRSKKEIIRMNRNWEKRFSVLRASMHELKDEAFVRRRIEFQPMALHTAKVQYRSKSTNSNNPNFPIRESRMNQHRKMMRETNTEENGHRTFSPCGSDMFNSTDDEVGDSDDDNYPENKFIIRPKEANGMRTFSAT